MANLQINFINNTVDNFVIYGCIGCAVDPTTFTNSTLYWNSLSDLGRGLFLLPRGGYENVEATQFTATINDVSVLCFAMESEMNSFEINFDPSNGGLTIAPNAMNSTYATVTGSGDTYLITIH